MPISQLGLVGYKKCKIYVLFIVPVVNYLASHLYSLKLNSASKIKIIALAVIYVLHVAFFDALMNHDFCNHAGFSISNASACNHDNSAQQKKHAYRLLTKHEQFKQVQTSVPLVFNLVFASLTFTPEKPVIPTQFCALPYLTVGGNKLYRIFKSLLI